MSLLIKEFSVFFEGNKSRPSQSVPRSSIKKSSFLNMQRTHWSNFINFCAEKYPKGPFGDNKKFLKANAIFNSFIVPKNGKGGPLGFF